VLKIDCDTGSWIDERKDGTEDWESGKVIIMNRVRA
jgi:hypothetical protein